MNSGHLLGKVIMGMPTFTRREEEENDEDEEEEDEQEKARKKARKLESILC